MSAKTYNAGVAARAKTNAAAMAAAKSARNTVAAFGDFIIGFVRGEEAPAPKRRAAAPKKPVAKTAAKPVAKKPVAKTAARRK